MEIIRLTKVDALRYTDAVRDRNPIHQTDEEARRYGLNEAIAPGMWLASHIQRRFGDIREIKKITFLDNVHYGDKLEISERRRRFGGGEDIDFKREDKLVCSISGITRGDYTPNLKPLKERVHTYTADACNERVDLFLSSIGCGPLEGVLPGMYIASLCAPALLDYGHKKGILGVHASLSFQMHSDYKPQDIQLDLGDERTKGNLTFFEIRWKQNGECIASGRAGVLPFKENLESKVK
jgi:hypothetical protein